MSLPKAKAAKGLQFLAADSPLDETWDTHRAYGDQLSEMLADAAMGRASVRVRDCAEALFFNLRSDAGTGELKWKLKSAPFCRYRHCPICQWRRSLKAKATVMAVLPAILKEHPTARFAMLTLTVKNCGITELRQTILSINKGWKRLTERKDWPALGWVRGVEVTAGEDCTAHPHCHALLMLPASYFSHGYVPTKEWVQRWRQAMRLDYDPVCDIRAIRVKEGVKEAAKGTDARLLAISSAVSETAKYATKTEDLLKCGPDWLREYVEQVNALKFLTSGSGALKGVLKDVRKKSGEDEDLVHVDGEEPVEGEVELQLSYDWRRKLKRYARKRD